MTQTPISEALVEAEAQDLEVMEARSHKGMASLVLVGLMVAASVATVFTTRSMEALMIAAAMGLSAAVMAMRYAAGGANTVRARLARQARREGLSDHEVLLLGKAAQRHLRRHVDAEQNIKFIKQLVVFVVSVIVTFGLFVAQHNNVALVWKLLCGASLLGTAWQGALVFGMWMPTLFARGVQRRRVQGAMVREHRRLVTELEVKGALELHTERRAGDLTMSATGGLEVHKPEAP